VQEAKNFIDIHAHILPGVDDGSANLEETLVMLQIAYDPATLTSRGFRVELNRMRSISSTQRP
jgi:hypothetical protein